MFEFLKNPKSQGANAHLSIQKISASKLTPLMVCEALNAPVLLESAFLDTGKGRFSILVLKVAFRIIKEKGKVFLQEDSTKHDLSKIQQIGDSTLPPNPKFLDFMEAFATLAPKLDSDTIPSSEIESLHLPLGGVGYLGYEFFSEIEEVEFSNPPLYDVSENAFIFGREFVVFDHFYETLYILCVSFKGESKPHDTQKRVQELANTLEHLSLADKPTQEYHSAITSKDKKSYYTKMVQTIKKEIYKGNLLQCVPSQSLQISSTLPPLQAYMNLRISNPSPYMYYFNFGTFEIVGSSPEVLVRVKTTAPNAAQVTIRPIAGTRARGKNALEDSKLEEELKANAKENAELNQINNALFYVGKAEEVLPREYEENKIHADVIVVDPPRKGCDEKCLETMVKMQPERIVYVSCDPATLARDLKYLCGNGYQLQKVQAVDQFAQTVHVETVCLLSKKCPV